MTEEEKLFENHYNYYSKIGIETIQQQAGQVEQVSSDYQGRVIYELLQNAFDKAKERILVKVAGNFLYVANDGTKFNYVADYDYDKNTTRRGDFQSLCSISTSTKNASTSIGNKGVGFKSAFSIATTGFVNIFTQGEIINSDATVTDEVISFRIYDAFKNVDDIPEEFNAQIKDNLKEKIELVHKERKDRGVPGYYFPLHIPYEEPYINQLFDDGFVTVIQIPFSKKEEIRKLFNEIEKIHFQFIGIKYPDYPEGFNVRFCFDEFIHEQFILKNNNALFSVIIENDEIQKLAREAGIFIEKPAVAFFIKDNANGLLYNYLPTQIGSPFKYVDFHADFHTTVDRKSINFDGSIGKYNKALLQACIELYFVMLNNSLDENHRITLQLEYINQESVTGSIKDFAWELLDLGNTYAAFYIVQRILRIYNDQYTNAAKLLAGLASVFFNEKKTAEQHNYFISTSLAFITYFARDDGQEHKWVNRFKMVYARQLKEKAVQFIPNADITSSNELLYRKKTDTSIQLPHFLGINITEFEIKDEVFRNALGIREFGNYNEILKYYKQCTLNGEYENQTITETEQKELLKSLAEIFLNKREPVNASSHRYTRVHTPQERETNSTANQAYFNISTIFLKTIGGSYKPAQLCKKKELDNEFLPVFETEDQPNAFLQFLGVSLDSNYIFSDIRIYNALKNGLNHIPKPYIRGESIEKLTGESILNNIRLVDSKGKDTHPALINDNNYSFLENISSRSLKPELDNLRVNSYDSFSREYLNILFEAAGKLPTGIERLYLRLFHPFHLKIGKYLITYKKELKWLTLSDVFYIAKNREDFEILKNQSIPVLCYYFGNEIPDALRSKIIDMKGREIVYEGETDITAEITGHLNKRMVYILSGISNSSQSELNFKEDASKIKRVQKVVQELKVFKTKKLSRKIECSGVDLHFETQFTALSDPDTNTIYLKENYSSRNITEVLARHIFNNSSIVSELELILFYKETDNLETDYAKEEVNYFRQLWVKDYDQKFGEYQKEVLKGFIEWNESIPEKWNIYNAFHKSELLLKLYKDGKINALEFSIEKNKIKYEGLFDDFGLEIDYGLNDQKISKMINYLQLNCSEGSDDYVIELKKISESIGDDQRLLEIENELILKYEYDISGNHDSSLANEIKKSLDFERNVNNIFEKISQSKTYFVGSFSAKGSAEESAIEVNRRKLIFQGTNPAEGSDSYLEATGAKGEELVLGFYIYQFLELSPEMKRQGIIEIYELIRDKLGNDTHEKFKDACLNAIEDNIELKKALIPYFYIAMNHKYAYFDLIVYKNGKPAMVEVKTTASENNNSFYISISEVNEARKEDNYEIVRVSPSEIIFMGNPIKEMDNKINSIKGGNYRLIPRNYKFEFSK